MFIKHSQRIPVAAISLLLVLVIPAWGDEPETVSDVEPKTEIQPVMTEEIEVYAEAPQAEVVPIEPEFLESGRAANLALALAEIPGVAGVRRSQNAYEPVVRGLGWERVQTQVNGVPLYGACPGRMDPPSTMFPTASVAEASLVKGLSSVTLGPAGTGGRIVVSTDNDRGVDAGRELDSWARLTHNGARDGFSGDAGVRGGTGKVDFSAGLEALDFDDYTSAAGTRVPANEEMFGGFFSFGHRPTVNQRWNAGLIYQQGKDIDYPSLPMNTDDTDSRVYTAGYRYAVPDKSKGLSEIEVSLGLSEVDHMMSNRGKPNRGMLEAETKSYADSNSARVGAGWLVSSRSVVRAGLDFAALERDALRERVIVASGATFYDHLWPDVSQDDLGLFAEYSLVPAPGWNLRVGLRFDDVSSAAAAADDPSLGGRTIRENYVFFYGPEAADTDRDESLFTGNVLASRRLRSNLTLHAGVGLVSRAASMTERYFAFAPAPNGFVVGNPTLDAEQKQEASLGAVFDGGRISGSLGVYYYSFDDYINGTILERRDVNGDGVEDVIRGFFNVEATLYGGDFSAEYRPTERFSFPMSVSYVRGQNDTDGTPLPEIPPLEGQLAARFHVGGRLPGWVELGGRFVDRQDRIDESFGENETPGFAVWHVRTRFTLASFVQIQVNIENLFDKEYHEHLTREAALPVGDLARGDEIPQPGRAFFVSARFTF